MLALAAFPGALEQQVFHAQRGRTSMKSVHLASSMTKWLDSDRSFRQASRRRSRRAIVSVELMESRVCLSAESQVQVPVASGADAIALGEAERTRTMRQQIQGG
jgi:hypothetical protein